MRDFQQKKRWRNIIESRPVLAILVILLLLFAWEVTDLFSKTKLTRENRQIAENKLKELEEKKEIFTSDVAKLNNQNGIEESIRERFPVVKEGEGLIIIVDEKDANQEPQPEKKSFFSFLYFWRWFK